MFGRRLIVVGSTAVVVAVVCLATLQAQERREATTQGREVTLHGKIVDLQCYMTEQFPSSDKVRCTRECIRAGVPAALETTDGLVIIGKGHRGPAQDIAPHAYTDVHARGKLYERNGMRYIDLMTVTPVTGQKDKPVFAEDEDWSTDDQEDVYDDEPEDEEEDDSEDWDS